MYALIATLYVLGTLLPFAGFHLAGGICFAAGICIHFAVMPWNNNWLGGQRGPTYHGDQYHTHYHKHEAPQFQSVSRAEEYQTNDYRVRRLTQWNGK